MHVSGRVVRSATEEVEDGESRVQAVPDSKTERHDEHLSDVDFEQISPICFELLVHLAARYRRHPVRRRAEVDIVNGGQECFCQVFAGTMSIFPLRSGFESGQIWSKVGPVTL